MTNMLINPALQPQTYAGKGNLIDKVNYGVEQTKNNFVGNLKTTAIAAGGTAATVGLTKVAAKSNGVQNLLTKAGTKFTSTKFGKGLVETSKETGSILKKGWKNITKTFKKLPAPAKAVAIAGAALTALITTNNVTKTVFKMGQTDQKYTDAAKLKSLQA